MKRLKIIGLAAVAAMAFMSFAGAADPGMPSGITHYPSPELAIGFLFISFSILGATALRVGTTRQDSPNRLITHCRATAITTTNNDNTTNTLIAQPNVEISDSQYDREAPPIPARAC